MRMVHAIQENHTEGAQQVQQTGVGGDAKIVYALLTGMVSDKVVYPVREYATNAWEVSPAGKPFEIELPTVFNPQFTIRDFGPGLSQRFMMKSYAKIGESTKDNDDDAVGGWGFGSKAALAYLMRSDGAGSFTVISRHRGFRRVYVIGVSEQGKIQIQFMGEWPLEPEDRGTGLEISFPVREDDIDRFHEHAQAVYWSFEPKPVITPAIDFGRPRVLHSGDGWTVYDPNTVPFRGPQVQLDPVMYPINTSLAPMRASELMSAGQVWPCIVFKAKIGTISVSASREALQYDDRTEDGLRALFQHYDRDWLIAARAKLNAETTYLGARMVAWDVTASLGDNRWGIMSQLTWNGFPFHADLFPEGGNRAKAALWPELRNDFQALELVRFSPTWKVNPGELVNRKVVIQHSTNRSIERLEAAGLLHTPVIWVRCRKVDLDYALQRMGNPEYLLLDSIKLPPAPKREKRPESVKRRRALDMGLEKVLKPLIDHDEELIYIEVEGRGRKRSYEVRIDGKVKRYADHSFRDLLRKARTCGIEIPSELPIVEYGEEIPEHWVSLGDYLLQQIDNRLDQTQVHPFVPWDYSSFPGKLRVLREQRVDLGMAPQELRDIVYDMVALQKTRHTLDHEPNEHDELAALNLKLTGNDLQSVAKDPTLAISNRWDALTARMPLLELLIDKMTDSHRSNYKLTPRGQKSLDHYFQLMAK